MSTNRTIQDHQRIPLPDQVLTETVERGVCVVELDSTTYLTRNLLIYEIPFSAAKFIALDMPHTPMLK